MADHDHTSKSRSDDITQWFKMFLILGGLLANYIATKTTIETQMAEITKTLDRHEIEISKNRDNYISTLKGR